MSDLIDRQATIDAIPEQKLWKERYEDLLEYFHGEDIILKDRKEFKAWLERIHWHVLECDKLARQLEEQPEIIRCKDCKHKPYPSDNYDYDNSDCGFEIIFPDYRCPCRCEDEYYNRIPDDDWFAEMQKGEPMSDVKLCPFCGGEVSVVKISPRLYRPSRNHPFAVVCYGCDLYFGYDEDYGGIFDIEEDAIREWNKREGAQE